MDAILQAESEVPAYLPSSRFDPHLPSTASDESFFKIVTKEFERPHVSGIQFDASDLGVYERVLLSAIAWSPYTVHCLVGEMGSGKTAVVKYLGQVLRQKRSTLCRKCTFCEPLAIRVDFNEGFTSEDMHSLKKTFRRRLYEQLKAELRAQFKVHFKVDDFVRFGQRPEMRSDFAVFDDFFESTDDESWAEMSYAKKANELFGFIGRSSTDMEHRLEMLMRLMKYIILSVRPEPACALLIFDNIDRLRSEAQMMLLLEIISLQRHARGRILISLRRTTFEKLASQRAYTFGVINHNGADPLLIARERIHHYLKKFEEEPLTASVDSRYSYQLKARLEYVYQLLNSSSANYVVDLIRGLSGESSRLGLHLMQRMFVNNVLSWDSNPKNPGELAWALLTGTSEHARLELQDPLVANVFTNGKAARPSLLILRILGVLYEFDGDPSRRTIGNLLTIGRAVGGWSQKEIIEAINYLMIDRRPLVWVDGRSRFSSLADTSGPSSREVLYLTSSGKRYFRELIMSLSYFQETMLSLEWSSPSVPMTVQMDDLTTRFRVLRACFMQLQEMDMKEVSAFLESSVAADALTPTVVTNRILYGVAKAAFLIFESQRVKGALNQEFVEWYNLLLQGFNSEHRVLGRHNSRINALIKDYRRQLKHYSG